MGSAEVDGTIKPSSSLRLENIIFKTKHPCKTMSILEDACQHQTMFTAASWAVRGASTWQSGSVRCPMLL